MNEYRDHVEEALERRDLEAMKVFLQKGYEVVDVIEGGETALHFAACLGYADVVSFLIQSGEDVNAVDALQWSALHYGSSNGHLDVVSVLIQNGASINVVDKGKQTPLILAVAKELLEIVTILLQNGADVNAVDGSNMTALLWAADRGHVGIGKLLIQNGADVHAVDEDNGTALHYVMKKGNVEFAKVLIRNGIDVNAVDEDNDTALKIAVERFHSDCVLQLVCSGAKMISKAMIDNMSSTNTLTLIYRIGYLEENLMSEEEARFMWHVAFLFTAKGGRVNAIAFKLYHTVRSFVTYRGIFMAPGYDLGRDSVWKTFGFGSWRGESPGLKNDGSDDEEYTQYLRNGDMTRWMS